MEIDLGPELDIKVKIGSKEVMLREPSNDDIEKMTEEVEGLADAKKYKAVENFVVSLGMTEEDVKSLGARRLNKLTAGLIGALSEKK